MRSKRDNLLSLLRRQGYDEVPVEFMLCPALVEKYRMMENQTMDYQTYFGMPWRRVGELIPDDTDLTRFEPYHKGRLGASVELDEWGVGHQSTPTSMHMTKMLFPLENAAGAADIERYPLPVYSNKNNAWLREAVEQLHQKGLASVGNMQCTIWETSWYLRGMENLMMDMLDEEPAAEVLLDRVTQMSIDRALLYARAGVDILYLGDDIGMQKSTMMSEDTYLQWIQPRLKRLIGAVKAVRPDIIVFYHSCGYITPFIPALIDAGIDVLNPIQPECMDFGEIYRKYGSRISFHGTIGTQSTMPFGTPQEVRREVEKNLRIAGEAGGLMVAPTHLLEPEVPWSNILAYVEACLDYKQ